MAHTLCMLDKQGDTHAHAEICNTYCFSSATMIRERASVLRYTYIVSFVLFVSAHIISLSLSFVFFLFRLFCRIHLCLFCIRLVPYRCLHSPVRSSVCPVTCLSISLSLSVTHQVFAFIWMLVCLSNSFFSRCPYFRCGIE